MKKLLLLVLSVSLYSSPSGEKNIVGKVEIHREGKDTLIHHQGKKAVIEWDSFSIGKNEHTKFLQATKDSSVLNRVVGNNPSEIFGKLSSNGKVYLLNQNGILIGKDAIIDTRSFIASALNLSNQCFLEEENFSFEGKSDSSVVNLGKIIAEKEIFLIARVVENKGSLKATETVGLAGGEILLKEGSQNRVYIKPNTRGRVSNKGIIQSASIELQAAGGNTYSLAVNHEGLIDATKTEERNGRVLLKAETGTTKVSGKILAHKNVHILGEKVSIEKGCIDVSSEDKAGEILIGGDYQGNNPDIPNAKITYVDKESKLLSNGLENGDGGKVILWGDESTSFFGTAEAMGGEFAGDGGLVEVSSKMDLLYGGEVTAKAPFGKAGLILFDPSDITISAGPISGDAFTTPIYNPTAATNVILASAVASALGGGSDVTIRTSAGAGGTTSGNVTISSDIVWSTANIFTVEADRNITVTSKIENTNATTSATEVIILDANFLGSAASTGSFYGVNLTGAGAIIKTAGYSIGINGKGCIGGSTLKRGVYRKNRSSVETV